MTGALTVQEDPAKGGIALRLPNAAEPGHIAFLNGDGTRKAWLGAGAGTTLTFNLDNATVLEIVGGDVDLSGGINFGSVAVSDQNNCTRHLKLWHNVNDDAKGFGLNITSGRMNFTVDSTSNMHCFMCGDTQAYMIDTAGATGNMISGTSFIDRSLMDDPTLADFVEGRDVRRDSGGKGMARRGVNLGKLLTHALKEIRELRAEVEQLKSARPAGRR